MPGTVAAYNFQNRRTTSGPCPTPRISPILAAMAGIGTITIAALSPIAATRKGNAQVA